MLAGIAQLRPIGETMSSSHALNKACGQGYSPLRGRTSADEFLLLSCGTWGQYGGADFPTGAAPAPRIDPTSPSGIEFRWGSSI